VAHFKQLVIRAARRLPAAKTQPAKRGIDYPVSFKVDPDAPLGFTLLDNAPTEYVFEEAVGV